MDTGDDHRSAGGADHGDGIGHCVGHKGRVSWAFGRDDREWGSRHAHDVARDLDVHGLLAAYRCGNGQCDALWCRRRIVEFHREGSDLLHHPALGVEALYAVVQQRVVSTLGNSGRSAHHDDRRTLSPCLRRAVHQFEAADSPRDHHAAKAAQPGVGVGGEPGALLVERADELHALLNPPVQLQGVVPGDAEDMVHTCSEKRVDQAVPDRRGVRVHHGSYLRR